MTLDEAIRFNQAIRNDLNAKGLNSIPEAIQLGIEALKRVKADRTLPYPIVSDLLPGETEE